MRLQVVFAAMFVLLTACGGDSVEADFRALEPVADCGRVTVEQGEPHFRPGRQQEECIARALRTRKAAQMTLTYPTVEGDLVRVHYRTTTAGSLEIYTDNTADDYGTQTWTYEHCPQAESIADRGRCD